MSDEELMDEGSAMEEVRAPRPRAAAADDDDDYDVSTRGSLAVTAFVDGLAPDLKPGAKARLLDKFASDKPGGGLRALVNHLHDPENCSRYMNPERPQPAIDPFRQLCRRFSGLLRKGEADTIYEAMCLDVSARDLETDPGKVAVRVWDHLHDHTPETRDLWLTQYKPSLPHHMARVLAAIEALGVPVVAPTDWAMKWSDLGGRGRSFADAVRGVATRSAIAGIARFTDQEIGRAISAEPAPPPMTPLQEEVLRLARPGGYEVM